MNNQKILNFLKANVGKDFNDSYDSLGCAQNVNNILKIVLGYVAGGGPSTAQMKIALLENPNFKEVSKNEARAGDIVLSATGTGNGRIAHGHVGFLGENGIIYSNNSAKDMLDNHLTASDWKNYFVLKGGFEVKYFRAIGRDLVGEIKSVPKILQSSQDVNKISLTVKSITALIIMLATQYGLKVNEVDVNIVLEQIILAIPKITLIYGIVRKYV